MLHLSANGGGAIVNVLSVLMDTDMTAGVDAPKSDPAHVAAQTLDGVEAGAHEILADGLSRHVRAALSGDLVDLYPVLGR
ncbi:MAG TPA: hypothetical protein PLV68_00305 [Ilumatobacteraceae bacterium]|nr:hypothetical protein [Ilumatobacteraceae bacterium]